MAFLVNHKFKLLNIYLILLYYINMKLDGAVLKLKEEVLRHVLQIVKYNRVEVSKDSFIPITIETLCMHSDTENSVKLLDDLNKFLIENSIKIEPYGH